MQYFEEQESEEFDMKEMRIFRKYKGIMQRKFIESKTQKEIFLYQLICSMPTLTKTTFLTPMHSLRNLPSNLIDPY